MSAKLDTTGKLRGFLADMIVGVKNGHLDVDKASRITKLAAQVTENLYAEIKVCQIRSALGDETIAPLGSLLIGETEDK